MSEVGTFYLQLEREKNYLFRTQFDWDHVPALWLDEPEPLGERQGPNASRLLGAAVGNCLSASLLFCLEKARHTVKNLHTEVRGTLTRNERGRLRIGKLDVQITLDVAAEPANRLERCLSLFEDYCVVTASVRQGIPVSVRVTDPQGRELHFDDGSGKTS